jgi:aarF domain-containing kinase
VNEAKMMNVKRDFLKQWNLENEFYVPRTVNHLCTNKIITQEFIYGMPLDEVINLSQEKRDRIGTLLLKITLYELFVFKFMQTDPNPANFYFDPEKNRINLIDYGSARHFSDEFC